MGEANGVFDGVALFVLRYSPAALCGDVRNIRTLSRSLKLI